MTQQQMRISRHVAAQHAAQSIAAAVLQRSKLFQFTKLINHASKQTVMDRYLRDEEDYRRRQLVKAELRRRRWG